MRNTIRRTAMGITALGTLMACDDGPTEPTSTTFVSVMSGANERPNANNSTATGTGTYVLTGNTLTFTIVANGLSAPVSGAHIHVGGPAVAGPVVFPFAHAAIQSGTVASGSIDLAATSITGTATGISGDSLRVLLNNGNAYTNVHTTSFPGGEIRGQISRQ